MKTVTSKDGTKIAYESTGRGPVLILVLGALNKRDSGEKLAQLLADHFTVVTYDRRGRGDSSDTKPYAVDKEVEDIAAIVDEFGGSARLYGHSSGAVLALKAAEVLGSKIVGLALYEVPYNTAPEAQNAAKEYKEKLEQLLAADKRGDAVALFIASVGAPKEQIEGMQHMPMWNGLTAMAPTLQYDTVELMECYPKIHLQEIAAPSLVMYGAASPGFMGDTATKLSKAMPQATLQSLEGQVHDVKPDVLAPVLVQFFE